MTLSSSNSSVGALTFTAPVAGKYTATGTFKASSTPGSTTFTASESGLTSATATLTSVVVGSPAKLAITVGNSQTVSSSVDGTNYQKVTISVQDANGNPVTGFNGKIGISSNSVTAQLYTASTIGGTTTYALYSAPVVTSLGSITFYVADPSTESVTYTASAVDNTGASLSATVPNVTASGSFTNGKAYSVSLATASPAYIMGDGSSIAAVTANVVDKNGNVVTNANGTFKFNLVNAYAFLQGADSQGNVTANVVNGKATVILQARSTTSPATLVAGKDLTATFTPSDSTVTLAGGTSVAVGNVILGIGTSADKTAPTAPTTAWVDATHFTVTFAKAVKAPTFVSSTNTGITGFSKVSTTDDMTYTVTLNAAANTGDKVVFTATDLSGNALAANASITK